MLGILLDGRGDLLSLETYPGRFAEPYGSSMTVAELHGPRVGRRSDLTVPFPEAQRQRGGKSDLDSIGRSTATNNVRLYDTTPDQVISSSKTINHP